MPDPFPEKFSPPFHKALDIKMSAGPEGEGIAWVEVDPETHYGNQWAHGGLAGALADISSGIAIAHRSDNPMDTIEGTIELKVNFLRKVVSGDMTATARVLHHGKRVAVTEVDITNEGRLCAKALATFMLKMPAD